MSPSNPTIVRKEEHVMTCPACQGDITADARIKVEMLEPTITQNGSAVGQVTVETKSTLVQFNVVHRCDGPQSDEPPTPPATKTTSPTSTSGSSEGGAGGDDEGGA